MKKKEKSLEDRFLDALDNHSCYYCAEYKSDVKYIVDPFWEDINNEIEMRWICTDCCKDSWLM